MKHIVTQEKAEEVFASIQRMTMFFELARIEEQVFLFDHRFRNPVMNNHIKRIRESLQALEKESGRLITSKDTEYFKYEHTPLLHVIFKAYMFQDKRFLEEVVNQLEDSEKQVA